MGDLLTIAVANPFDVVAPGRPAPRRRAASSASCLALEPQIQRRAATSSTGRASPTSADLLEEQDEHDDHGQGAEPRGARSPTSRPRRRRRRRPDRQAREPDHLPGHQGEGLATSTSSRSRSASIVRYRVDGALHEAMSPPKQLPDRHREPPQDHGEPRHRREAQPAGRQVPGEGRGPPDRLPRLDRCPTRARREGRDAHPRLEQPGAAPSTRSGFEPDALDDFKARHRRALRDDPRHRARRARARRRRSTPPSRRC